MAPHRKLRRPRRPLSRTHRVQLLAALITSVLPIVADLFRWWVAR